MARGFRLRLFNLDGQILFDQRYPALPIRIGRNALNDCAVTQNFVSDFHARIEDHGGRLCILDLNSKNGVFLRMRQNTAPARAPSQVPQDLAPYSNEFFVGPFLRGELSFVEVDPGIEREPKSSGTVLGNRQMLQAGLSESSRQSGGPAPGQLPALGVFPLEGPRGPAGTPGTPPPFGPPRAPQTGPTPAGYHAFGAPTPAPAPDLKSTGHFDLAAESLALQGLRELAGSLVPGQPFQTKGDVARLITKLHDTVEVFCRCFIPLREGHTQFVSTMDLQRAAMQRSADRSRGYMAVEMATSPGAVATALLDWRDPSLDAPNAIEGIFADLMLHQVALLDSLMQGVRALLEELSPENIERIVDGGEGRKPLSLVLGRHKALWEAFVARYEELSEEKQAFGHLFGPEFTQAYRDSRRRRSGNP